MKFLMVIAPKDFRDEEYWQPKEILEKGGVGVETASLKTGKIFGYLGGEAEATLTIDQVNVDDYVGVAFVGGQGMVSLTGQPEFIELAKKFFQAGKITAAICIAPEILEKAGLTTGKKYTKWGMKNGQAVAVDGHLITANGPAAALEFGQTILKYLSTTPS